jgi:hypothetical protein
VKKSKFSPAVSTVVNREVVFKVPLYRDLRLLTPTLPFLLARRGESAPCDLDTGKGEIVHRKKRFAIFPSGRGWFIDIPAGDRKIVNLFLQCMNTSLKTPFRPTGIGERYCQAISIIWYCDKTLRNIIFTTMASGCR